MILSDSSMSPSIFQRSLLADGVFAAGLSASATGEASLLADFIGREYRTGNDSSVSTSGDLITHSRSGNAVMTDGYGPELVVNGDFSSGDLTGWTDNSTGSGSVSVVNNTLLLAGTDTSNRGFVTSDSFTTKPNVAYVIELSVTDRQGSGDLQLQFSDVGGNRLDEFPITAKGRYQYTVIAQRTESYLKINCYDDDSVSIDNVSVREMPVLKWAPHNLALYSEQFDNAVWAKVRTTVTANQTTAPDGTTTADKIIETAETGNHFIVDSSSVSFSVGQIGTSAVFLKAGERSAAVMQITDPSSPSRTRLQAIVDLSAGTITTQEFNSPTNIKSSITDAGNGWYLVKLSMATKAAGPMECLFGPLDSTSYTTNLPAYTGDGSSGIYAWGAHIFRSDLGGMADNPDRGDSYVPTAGRPVGANLVLNGTFDTDSDWTKGTGWTISGGKANHAAGTASQLTSTNSSLLNGEVYEVRFTVSNRTAGSLLLEGAIWTSAETISANGDYVFYKVKSGDGPAIFYGSGTFDGSIDDITVRKSTVNPAIAAYLPRIGHHVFNGSAWVNEGLLAESEARTNLIERSNTFDSGWSATGLSGRAANEVGPDGVANSAYTLTTSTATAIHANGNMTLFTSGSDHTGSCYLKKGTQRYVKLRAGNTTTWPANVIFDLDNGIVDTEILGTGTIQEVGNGWYRCSVTATAGATANTNFNIYILNDSKAESYTGTGAETAIVWGAQVEIGTTPSSFIPSDDGTSTITRAAETFTIPSANLPWPSPSYIGSELVTNGTFDTDSDWTKGTNATISGGTLSYAGGSGNGDTYQNVGLVVGKVYWGVFTVSNRTAGSVKLRQGGVSSGGTVGASADGTYSSAFVVPSGANANLLVDVSADFVGDIDNISVREINPLSVSIAMDGAVTYADEDSYSTSIFYRWFGDANNYLVHRIDTALTQTGHQVAQQRVDGVDDYSTGNPSNTMFSPDVLVPFDIAVRHGSTFVQVASDGLTPAANTTPTALPDLSANDLSLAYDYMGTIGTFRVWDKDLGDTGIVEATNPSLEPSLSLTFEGTGTNSFVVNDWSE